MDLSEFKNGDIVFDIDSRTMSEEAGCPNTVLDDKLGRTSMVSGVSMNFDGLVDDENEVNLINSIQERGEVSPENMKVLINQEVEGDKAADIATKRMRNERRKTTSAKKPPRPPRPPKGLSLDAADQKLIKEIAELAMMKRARIERMKALKKMKAAKSSSASYSSGIFFALLTLLFCIVIVVQGISCRNCSALKFNGSRVRSGSVENMIMVQFQRRMSANDTSYPGSESPNSLKQVSGSDAENKEKRGSD